MKLIKINRTKMTLVILAAFVISAAPVSGLTTGRDGGARAYVCGDCNRDGNVNLIDILYLVDHIYAVPPGAAPDPFEAGDADADGTLNLVDILYLIDYIYGNPRGPEPICEYGPPSGEMIWHSECKTPEGKLQFNPGPDSLDCLEFHYDGQGTLILIHINGALNCCPVIISEIYIFEDGILIEQIDSLENGYGCPCMCLFDFEYRFENIEPGTYTIRIVEPYRPAGDEELIVTLQLFGTVSGEECFTRSVYPWREM